MFVLLMNVLFKYLFNIHIYTHRLVLASTTLKLIETEVSLFFFVFLLFNLVSSTLAVSLTQAEVVIADSYILYPLPSCPQKPTKLEYHGAQICLCL